MAVVLAGLGILVPALPLSHDATRPTVRDGIRIPIGPRVSNLFEPDHGNEERHKGPPPESPLPSHVASASTVNAAGVSIGQNSRYSTYPFVLLALLIFAAYSVGGRVVGGRIGLRVIAVASGRRCVCSGSP